MRKTDRLGLNLLDMTDNISLEPINENTEFLERAVTSINRTNILDNWYLSDPVNQRGQAEYTGTGYSIDRWRTNFSGDTVVLTGGGVKNINVSTSAGWHLHQIVADSVRGMAGSIITASFLVSDFVGTKLKPIVSFRDSNDNEISALTLSAMSVGLNTLTGAVPSETVKIRVGLYGSGGIASGDYTTLFAAKLELGSTQTLAYKDENGSWVLNDPAPDKRVELLRCCMSTADSADNCANNKVTAAAINAVNKNGDTMTGTKLGFGGGYGDVTIHASAAMLQARNVQNDTTNRRALVVYNSNGMGDLKNALRLIDTIDGTSTNYDILHTGNFSALGGAKIAFGSYEGTGNFGERYPNTLTFEFEPKFVFLHEGDGSFVFNDTYSGSGAVSNDGLFIWSIGQTSYTLDSYSSHLVFTQSGKSLSWYHTAQSTANALSQRNASGHTYHYIAIG